MLRNQTLQHVEHHIWLLIVEAEQENTGMLGRRVSPHIAEPEIEDE